MFLTHSNCWVSWWLLKAWPGWARDPELCEVTGGCCACTGAERHMASWITHQQVWKCTWKPFFSFLGTLSCFPEPWSRDEGTGAMPLTCACICSSAEVRAEECCCNYGCRQGLSIMGIRVWLSQRFPVWSWSSHLITFASFLSCTVYILRLQLPALSI